jgi:glutamate--cysteine ligase catalytic subunit
MSATRRLSPISQTPVETNLLISTVRMDANMRRAERRNAVNDAKFYFRRHMAPVDEEEQVDENGRACCDPDGFADNTEAYEEMTCAEIIDGKGDYFPGLAPLAYAYLEHIGCDAATLTRISAYIEFVRKRARGELPTAAKWIRDFVSEHPDYEARQSRFTANGP